MNILGSGWDILENEPRESIFVLKSNTKDRIPPGYGNSLNNLIELFPIKEFENGTKFGIPVDPLGEDNYFTQVAKFGVDVLSDIDLKDNDSFTANSDDKYNSVFTTLATKSKSSEPQYFMEWLKDQGIYDAVIENRDKSYDSSSGASSSGSSSSSSDGANIGGIVGGTIGGLVLLSIFIGAISFLVYKRRRSSEYNPIE